MLKNYYLLSSTEVLITLKSILSFLFYATVLSCSRRNLPTLEGLALTERLLEFVFDASVTWTLTQSALEVISALLGHASPQVFKCYSNQRVDSFLD